ncbi:MAG: hypothetical protein GX090_07250 [Firmicutes bacterium]|nr:hypothetical protein [Bacillota bacterium]
MAHLNQMELQNLRHMIGCHELAAQKLETYARSVSDSQIRQMFQQSAQSARSAKQKLMSFLS